VDKQQSEFRGEKKEVYVLILGKNDKKKGDIDIYDYYSLYNSDLSGLLQHLQSQHLIKELVQTLTY
jgi:hypothetical protein